MRPPERDDLDPAPFGRLSNPILAVIFDMDGTLLDTEALHQNAFREAGRQLGWPLPEALLLSMIGINRDANERMLARTFGDAFPLREFYGISDAIFDAAAQKGAPLRPGAMAILEHFEEASMPMAIATSTAAPFAQNRLEAAGLLHYFDLVVTRTDVEKPKPDPEPYLLAAQRLGVHPAECIAVEDSPTGLLSATRAGIPTILIPDLLLPSEEHRLLSATVLPSLLALRDLLREPARNTL